MSFEYRADLPSDVSDDRWPRVVAIVASLPEYEIADDRNQCLAIVRPADGDPGNWGAHIFVQIEDDGSLFVSINTGTRDQRARFIEALDQGLGIELEDA